MLTFFQNYFKFSAIQLTSCYVILCPYFLPDKSTKFIKYLSSWNSAKVNPTTKISSHFRPPQTGGSQSQRRHQWLTCLSLEINNWIIPPEFSRSSAKFKVVLSSCGSGHDRKYWKAGQKSLFKSSKRAK